MQLKPTRPTKTSGQLLYQASVTFGKLAPTDHGSENSSATSQAGRRKRC
ncbi:hypothetical protein TGAMA5MH_08845 [Trichoderma gamsii]|uniref:Uncharacterized protein n=1 Tax=Trichoderma gamsii TaxID=398673 RepID=A0A2K0T0W5_9HYPO|nr:hypothetical protein TGAMA5MH_08845 [Trichoderma gamsii]